MTKQNQAAEVKSDKKNRPRVKPPVVEELSDDVASLAKLPGGPIAATGDGTIQTQAARLSNPHLQTVQRQAMAVQIGRVQGNQHLQRVVTLLKQNENTATAGPVQREAETAEEAGEGVASSPPVSGEGEAEQPLASGGGTKTIKILCTAKATYDRGTFRSENIRLSRSNNCGGDCECRHVTGRLASTFKVTTKVTLPKPSEYSHLTPCQRKRVKKAIDDVLTPHEQKHVDAFKTYNGTVHTPIDLTLCKDKMQEEFDQWAEKKHQEIAIKRENDAQRKSDNLDPFSVNIDLDCED